MTKQKVKTKTKEKINNLKNAKEIFFKDLILDKQELYNPDIKFFDKVIFKGKSYDISEFKRANAKAMNKLAIDFDDKLGNYKIVMPKINIKIVVKEQDGEFINDLKDAKDILLGNLVLYTPHEIVMNIDCYDAVIFKKKKYLLKDLEIQDNEKIKTAIANFSKTLMKFKVKVAKPKTKKKGGKK